MIYLDNQATTPTDPRVVEAMLPFFTTRFANPHSPHAMGRDVEEAVEPARSQIAALIGAEPREIVFTSGATESNNLAIAGAARFRRDVAGQDRTRIVTLATEHKCVLESVAALAREGFETVVLPVKADGLVDLEQLAAAVDERTALVSVMAANNEIGVLQPIADIAAIAHAAGALFHTDAAQAAGKVPLDVRAQGIDLMSLSAHKLYGPMGVGALFVRYRPRVRLVAQMQGGGQERGLRSGTLPAPLLVGFGLAAGLADQEMAAESARLLVLRQRFLEALRAQLQEVRVNAALEPRLPGNLNLCLPGIDAEALMAALPELCLSTGSACTSASVEPSYVLRALGLPEADARASFRVGIGRFTTAAEIDEAAGMIAAAVRGLRSP